MSGGGLASRSSINQKKCNTNVSRTHIIAFRVVLTVALTAITHLAFTPQQYPVLKDIPTKRTTFSHFMFWHCW